VFNTGFLVPQPFAARGNRLYSELLVVTHRPTVPGVHDHNSGPRAFLSVFSALARYTVVKITCSNSEVVLRILKHTVIYRGSGPTSKVIALLHPMV
jgi:hypothetical protein